MDQSSSDSTVILELSSVPEKEDISVPELKTAESVFVSSHTIQCTTWSDNNSSGGNCLGFNLLSPVTGTGSTAQ